MKQHHPVKNAIDESLGGVHFDERDMHHVLRAVRSQEDLPSRRPAHRTAMRLAPVLAMTLVVATPMLLFALNALNTGTTRITAGPGVTPVSQPATADPHADLIIATTLEPHTTPERTELELELLRIAQTCFEEVCDTSIFSFDEYAADISREDEDTCLITLESIYDNGCIFSVRINLKDKAVVSYSTPELATMPTYLNHDSPEIAAWYAQYGPYPLAWTQSVQAEFTRRYEGGLLRVAKPGELTAQEASALAMEYVAEHVQVQDAVHLFVYPLLYAERASSTGEARYVVSCYTCQVKEDMPDPIATVSMKPDGSDIVVTVY